MIERIVLATTVAMIGLGIVLLLALAVRSVWTSNREVRRGPIVEAARRVLVDISARDDPTPRPDELAALGKLTAREADDLFCRTAAALSGVTHARLTQLADRAGILARARRQLADRRWWRRLDAAATLQALGEAPTVGDDLADDPHPAVRLQAIEWWLEHPCDRSVRRLAEMLGDPDRRCVFAAQTALLQIDHEVDDALLRVIEHDADPATVRAAVAVASRVASGRLVAALEPLASHADPAIRTEVALALATHDDVDALAELANDDDTAVRAAAMRSISTTGVLTCAPLLRRGLDDDCFDVRRSAAFGLAQLGPAGMVALRVAASGADQPAGDIATRAMRELTWEAEGSE